MPHFPAVVCIIAHPPIIILFISLAMKPLNIRIKAPKQPEPQVTQPVVQPTQPAVQPTTTSKITFKKKIGFDGSVHSHPTQNAQTVKNQLVIFNDAKS
jgi:hypothetical protein